METLGIARAKSHQNMFHKYVKELFGFLLARIPEHSEHVRYITCMSSDVQIHYNRYNNSF